LAEITTVSSTEAGPKDLPSFDAQYQRHRGIVDVLNVLRKNAEGRFGPSPCKGLGPIIRPSLFLAPFIHDAGMEKLDGTSLVSNFCPGETEET